MQERRAALGGYLPSRNSASPPLVVPPLEAFSSLLEGTADREISTTMALVRMLTTLVKDKNIGKHIVPIVPDEARTFGMEGMFRQIGIYSSVGQLYTPQDADQLMFYREDKQGQATVRREVSWSAARPGAPPSRARDCSIKTGTASWSRPRFPTAWPTIPPTPMSSP